ncbi:formylglycine-generating enzyme family protein [Sorangium sp. So ce118]
MRTRTTLVGAGLLAVASVTTASCAKLIGLEDEYQEAGGTSSATGSGGGATGSGGSGSGSGGGGAGAAGMGGDGGGGASGSGGSAPYVGPPSCAELAATCGANADEDCCAAGLVEGGTFHRDNHNDDEAYAATVSSFHLDRFEITVGRFRKFVEAYPGSKPAVGDGAHPKIADSGWLQIWNTLLPATQEELVASLSEPCGETPMRTWTDTPGAQERKPMNCVKWFEAFAFCAWDGGRLPTEAEWNLAAAAGSEQRVYPWGTNEDEIDSTYAVYNCIGDGSTADNCQFSDILPVGSRSPKGDGKWGQADLAGSVWEFVRDSSDSDYPVPCNDCALIEIDGARRARGGAWNAIQYNVTTDYYTWIDPAGRFYDVGARCARDVSP